MIYLDNGISVFSGKNYRLDPKKCVKDCMNLISHAHFDHVPSSFEAPGIVCSDITGKLLEARSGISAGSTCCSCEGVKLLDSGHIPGSSMFLIEGDKRILYTGDLCTRKKYFTEGAKPVNADILIIESTFGKEKYVFPPAEEIIKEVRDWVDENTSDDKHSIIFAYTLGKAQEMIKALSGYNIYASRTVMAMNKALKDSGFEFDSMEVPSEPEMTSVVIAPSASRSQPEIKRLLQQGARTASVSGWALDEGHKYAMRVDRAFPLSDHADYKELLGFITGVSPEIVYTIHGFDKEFAKDIQKNTGINAMHLKKHHASLASYY